MTGGPLLRAGLFGALTVLGLVTLMATAGAWPKALGFGLAAAPLLVTALATLRARRVDGRAGAEETRRR